MSEETRSKIVQELPKHFPKSIEILEKCRRINFAAFTRLHPHSKLSLHRHQNPYGLIFHLGLIVPRGDTCGLTVNNLTHTWHEPGEAVIFNDNHEHFSWNDSSEERVLLYIDFFPFSLYVKE